MNWLPDAVIFDMDGVLINSEPLWRRAMIQGFAEYNMPVTEEQCRSTMGMRFGEVTRLWLKQFGFSLSLADAVERRVVDLLLHLIDTEGEALQGATELIDHCKKSGIKCGLATSSSEQLMVTILRKLSFDDAFEATVSAEHLQYGKPHPEVFLKCAELLKTPPEKCLVIEDSLNGVIAARAASMIVIAVPDDESLGADQRQRQQFALAHHCGKNMLEALALFKTHYSLNQHMHQSKEG